jgi:hypothetical protein
MTQTPLPVNVPIPPVPSGIVALQYIPVWYVRFNYFVLFSLLSREAYAQIIRILESQTLEILSIFFNA